MKRRTRTIIALTVAAVLMLSAAIIIGALTSSERSMAIIKYVIGNGEEPENGDVNNDGSVDIYDALIALKEDRKANAYLSKITFDDEAYSIDFDRETFEYTVEIPLGHPAIPQVEGVTMEGLDVVVQQAFIPEGEVSGTAYILVTNESGKSNTYTVTFEKTAEAGFELQYDDRYTFKPAKELADGESYTFTSDKPELVSVDENGVMTALKVTNEPVTVTASCGEVSENLVITQVDKAHVNLFLLTGQSNGQGHYGNSKYTAADPGYLSNEEQFALIPDIGVNGAVYSYDAFPISTNSQVPANTFYDMNDIKRQGPADALGKEFYELSGEKVVFLQTSYSGAPIQSWLDPETRPGYAGYYGATAKRNFYDATQKAYAELMAYLDANNYEVIRTCNFWWHGGTATVSTYDYDAMDYVSGKPKMTDQEYYDLYMMLHEDMIRDFGVEYDFMILNRIQRGACSSESKALYRHTDLVPIRAAQIALTNTNTDIVMVSTVGDIATPYAAADKENPGWNYVGLDNVHFNQTGHNATGEECGENAFYALSGLVTAKADHVEIIDTNGRDRLTSDDMIEMKVGSTHRIGALAYPIYSEDITYSSSKESVATINEFGVITAVSDGYAMISATSESGKTQSVAVWVYSPKKENVTYRWDFNDLTATGTANPLMLSPNAKAAGAGNNYTLTEGIYSKGTSSIRADFNLTKAITLNSENAWEIEWRAKFNGTSFLLGQYNPDNTVTSETRTAIGGRIYNGYSANFGGANPYYPIRFIPDTGSETRLVYGTAKTDEYVVANSSMNTWKMAYTPEDNMLSLYLQKGNETDGYYWETVDSKKAGTFSVTFNNLFGRPYGDGYLNFNGSMDYIQAKFVQEYVVKETNYRYDFNGNLLSSAEKNDLTLSPDAIARGSDSTTYSFDNDSIVSTGSTYVRPDFVFEKPIKVSSNTDWTIEWAAKLSTSSQLMGQSLKEPTVNGATQYGCIYLGYSSEYNGYSFRFKLPGMSSSAPGYRIIYGEEFRTLNTKMNTWKVEYKAENGIMTLYFKGTNGWETVGQVTISEQYEFTFTNLFGTYQKSGYSNLKGTVDYVDIYTKEKIYG